MARFLSFFSVPHGKGSNGSAESGAERQEWHVSISHRFKSTYSLLIGGCAESNVIRTRPETEKSRVLESAKGCREPEQDGSSEAPILTQAWRAEPGQEC
ncbi:hypothetical protein Y1Q_0002340 [Alligator mississippiensis]|uniref:Uncharacterized protein n=1 Tax=Alligator mississippiensis TaxID=8496 RepID=A0A151MGR4_ALLMI|nr:hypothetical protein Y1Q_0002340 [Alligator mississippiensis]